MTKRALHADALTARITHIVLALHKASGPFKIELAVSAVMNDPEIAGVLDILLMDARLAPYGCHKRVVKSVQAEASEMVRDLRDKHGTRIIETIPSPEGGQRLYMPLLAMTKPLFKEMYDHRLQEKMTIEDTCLRYACIWERLECQPDTVTVATVYDPAMSVYEQRRAG